MTKTISEIVDQRKRFVSRAYNFLNHHQDILDELKLSIMDEMSDDLQNENLAMKKWVEQTNNLDKFNRETKDTLKKAQEQGVPLAKDKILEINYFRNYYQQQIDNSKKHYAISLANLSRKKKVWRMENAEYMRRTINSNTDYKENKTEIDRDLPRLKEYTEGWNKDAISDLFSLIGEARNILKFSEALLPEISSAISTESVDMTSKSTHINQISAQKNSIVMRKCEELSDMLKKFENKHNFDNLTKKHSLSFFSMKDFVLDSLYDSAGSGMRASIRIIKRMTHTEKKINELIIKVKDLIAMFEPKYASLKDRKEKMTTMCISADALEENTVYRWIDVNFADIFTPIDEKVQKMQSNIK